jgi:hypothetical protein
VQISSSRSSGSGSSSSSVASRGAAAGPVYLQRAGQGARQLYVNAQDARAMGLCVLPPGIMKQPQLQQQQPLQQPEEEEEDTQEAAEEAAAATPPLDNSGGGGFAQAWQDTQVDGGGGGEDAFYYRCGFDGPVGGAALAVEAALCGLRLEPSAGASALRRALFFGA